MPGPESVRGYLDAVEAQIRWKRARTVAARELETHLEEQQEEFLAEGHPPEEAERLAVEDMGDPVAVGADLDRLHRPRPQWGMLGLTLALLLVGGWLRYALTRAGAPWDEDLGSAALCSVSGDRGCCAGRSLLPGRLPAAALGQVGVHQRPYRWCAVPEVFSHSQQRLLLHPVCGAILSGSLRTVAVCLPGKGLAGPAGCRDGRHPFDGGLRDDPLCPRPTPASSH